MKKILLAMPLLFAACDPYHFFRDAAIDSTTVHYNGGGIDLLASDDSLSVSDPPIESPAPNSDSSDPQNNSEPVDGSGDSEPFLSLAPGRTEPGSRLEQFWEHSADVVMGAGGGDLRSPRLLFLTPGRIDRPKIEGEVWFENVDQTGFAIVWNAQNPTSEDAYRVVKPWPLRGLEVRHDLGGSEFDRIDLGYYPPAQTWIPFTIEAGSAYFSQRDRTVSVPYSRGIPAGFVGVEASGVGEVRFRRLRIDGVPLPLSDGGLEAPGQIPEDTDPILEPITDLETSVLPDPPDPPDPLDPPEDGDPETGSDPPVLSTNNLSSVLIISNSGADGGVGTLESPLRSLQRAIDIAEPGTQILLRGGVYRDKGKASPKGPAIATFGLGKGGTAGSPIVVSSYPGEEAILDGAVSVTGWMRVSSAIEVAGNPNWTRIWRATSPVGKTSLGVHQGHRRLVVAQKPNANDPIVWDDPHDWPVVPSSGFTLSTLNGKSLLGDKPSTFWQGGTDILVWSGNNVVFVRPLQSYNPSTGMVSFSKLPIAESYLEKGKDRWAIRDHPSLIDEPGEFYMTAGGEIFLYPFGDKPEAVQIENVAVGLDLTGTKHVRIENLKLRHFSKFAIYKAVASSKSPGIEIVDVDVESCSGAGIQIGSMTGGHVRRTNVREAGGRGILIQRSEDFVIEDSYVEGCKGTGFAFFGVEHGKILRNRCMNNRGVHANAITVYLDSYDVLIERNFVYNSKIALTVQSSSKITARNNIFDGRNATSKVVAIWGGQYKGGAPFDHLYEHNVVIGSNTATSFYTNSGIRNTTIRSSVIDGLVIQSGLQHSHNVFTKLSHTQRYSLGAYSESHEPDVGRVFRDYEGGDFTVICSGCSAGAHDGGPIGADWSP